MSGILAATSTEYVAIGTSLRPLYEILYFLRATLISLASCPLSANFCLAMILSFALMLALPFWRWREKDDDDDDNNNKDDDECDPSDREEEEAMDTAAAGLHRLSHDWPTGCFCLFPISARAPLVVAGRLPMLEISVEMSEFILRCSNIQYVVWCSLPARFRH